jgi:ABC-type multidrug transport system ATPase subunit
MPAIEIRDVGKTYGGARGPVRALDRGSFDIEVGEFFGLLGAPACSARWD